MNTSLRRQLSLIFLAITSLILLLSSIFVYLQVMDILQSRSEQSTIQLFRQVERGLATFRNEAEQVAYQVQMAPLLREVLEQKGTHVQHLFLTLDLRELFKQTMAQYRYFDSIYLFTEDGEVVGASGTRSYSLATGKDHPFYQTALYQREKNPFSRSYWYGGQQSADFMERSEAAARDHARDLLTFVRYIAMPTNPERSAMLIFNIKERELAAIYQDSYDGPDIHTYLVDREGMIISATDKQTLGQASDARVAATSGYGSYTEWGERARQVVHYELANKEWRLVREIPLKLFNRDVMRLREILILITVISLTLVVLLTFYGVRRILLPLQELTAKMKRLQHGDLGVLVDPQPQNEIGLLGMQFNRMSQSIRDLIDRNEETEHKKREVEVKVLQAQITPHFLHNTLNSIKWIALVSNARHIADGIASLGGMLHLFYRDTALFGTVRDELAYIQHYVKLMNMRYGEGITLRQIVPETLADAAVLKLSVQPLVENAILHGFENKHYRGTITITVREEGELLLIEVADDGSGMSVEQLERLRSRLSAGREDRPPGESIGLSNTHYRLQLHYGQRYGVSIASGPEQGTAVVLRMPKSSLDDQAM
ncbi:two-component sensor histidine kinase [Paenibacillus sp. 598K]|uniref:cache domain-containing sensor histidine kinase n=1 Tax=Paenibacillus sp. 598K TaxID=1117987 RepID=UPI000FFAC7C6|nr:sensor histidine kinase [Paenibacillus sp. 598K]GBF76200.1 two-component sensor histidine kinase [Paenibacillus sp. 598K]